MKAIAVVALSAAFLVPSTAVAKEGLELSSTPDGLAAGQPWDVDIRPLPPEHPLPATHGIGIQITKAGSGEQKMFPAARNRDGSYRASVVFPRGGVWDYEVVGLGPYHQQDWPPVDIAGSTSSDSGSFPWGWLVGGAGAVALIALLVARFRPWRSSASGPSAVPPPSSS
jgi:hypothetical protein